MNRLLLAMLLLVPAIVAAHADGDFDTQGYRLAPYRSPTPEMVEGAVTLDTLTLQELIKASPSVVLIDVYNVGYANGYFLQDGPHWTLPGAVWLPNTGNTPLEPPWGRYLERHLIRLTEGERSRPLVFFCRSDCWLSWNVAKRAATAGYTAVYWYRTGVDGWREAGGKVEVARPEPFVGETKQ